MKRNIHITNQFNQHNIYSSTPVAIDNINSIVNDSVDSVVCGILEYISDDKLETTVETLLNKIRDNGSITLTFTDMKNLFLDYINQEINSSFIFNALKNKQNILSIDKVIIILNKHGFIVSKIDKNNNDIILIAHKQQNSR